jgi:hypothetical protein
MLQPYQLPDPTSIGYRALALRRSRAEGGGGGYDPQKFFQAFLQQNMGLRAPGAGPPAALPPDSGAPDTLADYGNRAQRLDTVAARGKAMQGAFSYDTFKSLYPNLNYNNFLAINADRINELNNTISNADYNAQVQRMGGQVFAGGPGAFTDSLNNYQKAINNEQSIGGTYDSQAGAAQAAAGNAAYLNTARSELAGPLDESTTMARASDREIFGGLGFLPGQRAAIPVGGAVAGLMQKLGDRGALQRLSRSSTLGAPAPGVAPRMINWGVRR